MKILLDECVTKKFKSFLQGFDVFTVNEMRWSGIKNGKLMGLCCDNGFDILLTIDKNLMHQQNLDKFNLTIVVLNTFTSKIEELIQFIPSFKLTVNSMEKYKAYLIEK
jgi:hypothetical protein